MTSRDAGAEAAPAIELVHIDKRFGAVHANKAISLVVPKGTIHGIVGENGAGKSTLMSILYGYYQADSGEIRVDGRRVVVRSPSEAIAAGIGMVHQHFMLVDDMTVLENMILGVEGDWRLRAGLAKARAAVVKLAEEYGLEVEPDAVIGDLPVGLQQRVEILKALYRGAEILVLDEPTAVLTPQEADQLFHILRALKRQGKTIVLITHKLREILDATDNVSVMRQGEMVATLATRAATREQLAELMVGRKVLLRVDKAQAEPGDVVIAVDDLRVRDRAGHERVKGVSFEVRRGEIVGIAGVSGNGQSEVLEALAGTAPIAGGRILFKGRDITADPARTAKGLRELGVGHVPEDRHRQGLVTAFEANESAILGHHDDRRYSRGPFMQRGAIVGDCDRLMGDFDVRPRAPRLTTALFSGGNQQKIVLAREMDRAPDLLLVGQPTRGVDIGAIEYIHKRLVEMRDRGAGVLLVSVELDEILSLADRILVMFDGRIVGQCPVAKANERTIGLMMAGAEAI